MSDALTQGGLAWGWVAHLRDGGSTPWAEWLAEPRPVERSRDHAPGRVLPGAQQLELLRRVNAAAESSAQPRGDHVNGSTRLESGLAERILTAAAPGRGKPDLALAGAGPEPAWGPRPVDPADLPAHELARVATSVLADDVVALGVPEPSTAWPRPWRRRYRLVGDPLVAADLRADLSARGRPPGGRRPTVIVLAGPFDRLLADTWSRRCFERSSTGWPEWLRFWRERDALPTRVDLARAARPWAERHAEVCVVTDPARLPRLLGVGSLPHVEAPGADVAELGRRIATVLGLLVPKEERAALMSQTLWPRIPRTTTPPVVVPPEHRDWLAAQAERQVRLLRRAGYAVAGDLADLAPGASPQPAGGLDEAVLALAVEMLVERSWMQKEVRQ